MNVKNNKCPLQWWEKHENMFPVVGFYARQILRIVGSQIRILTSLRRCLLSLKKLDKLIFVNKNDPLIQR
jgi:hypothetical protein